MAKIGTVTIGQTPRSDLLPELIAILGRGVEIVERGALDGLTREEIAAIAPGPGDYVLVTRLRDGSSVQIAEKHILPRMQECIRQLAEEGVDAVALLCTGQFPPFHSSKILLRPQPILYNLTTALAGGLTLGVMVPSREQLPQSHARWKDVAAAVKCVAASPYVNAEEGVEQAAHNLEVAGVELVVMDCVGYTAAMKRKVGAITGAPVILARSVVARVLAELVRE